MKTETLIWGLDDSEIIAIFVFQTQKTILYEDHN